MARRPSSAAAQHAAAALSGLPALLPMQQGSTTQSPAGRPACALLASGLVALAAAPPRPDRNLGLGQVFLHPPGPFLAQSILAVNADRTTLRADR
jgi:hypothetical protein